MTNDNESEDLGLPDLSALTGGDNPLGGMDLGGLLASAQEMMAGMQAAASEVVVGSAGGSLVTIEMDGHFDVKSVSIDPSAIDADDPSILEDLVLAAFRDGAEQVKARQNNVTGDLGMGGLDGLLGGE